MKTKLNFIGAMNVVKFIRTNKADYPTFASFADKYDKRFNRTDLMRLWFYANTTEGEETEEKVKAHF